MSLSKTVLNTLIAGAFAVSMAGITCTAHAEETEKEKCYGVAKAGANDCGSSDKSHACAAHASASGLAVDFLLLPKGICEKLNGGSLMAPEAKTDEKKE